jgi:hypothetical protein|tara:strand:+ start:1110 stop:1349 length:240 start_codon:yes stop_codon:yes gene_type:complete
MTRNSITSKEISEMVGKYQKSSGEERVKLNKKLDDIANAYRFTNNFFIGADGIDRDRVVSELDRFGAENTYEYLYGGDD